VERRGAGNPLPEQRDRTGNGLLMTLWLAIPVMVFSFNHSPIISSFAVAKREEYGEGAEKNAPASWLALTS
jgi:amino acid permease